ncbi:spore coat protein U domain-containing protein, partial [Pseudomonas sp.]|uniref:spore coat protein U domain-containing protein n=1 Tax=Pseudomonas sp. TaxID=306 RepID=UPI0026224888
ATLTVVCRSDASAVNVSYQLMTDTAGYGEQGMAGSNGEASYQLYTDGSYRQLWGDTSSSAISDSYALAANSTLSRVYTVYARMQPGRRVGPGQYLAIRGVRLVY